MDAQVHFLIIWGFIFYLTVVCDKVHLVDYLYFQDHIDHAILGKCDFCLGKKAISDSLKQSLVSTHFTQDHRTG